MDSAVIGRTLDSLELSAQSFASRALCPSARVPGLDAQEICRKLRDLDLDQGCPAPSKNNDG